MADERTMRERVARRLAIIGLRESGLNADEHWRAWLNDADTIFDELREPTEAMEAAGIAAGGKAYEYTGDTQVCHPAISWPAMIDAAKQGVIHECRGAEGQPPTLPKGDSNAR